MSSTLRAVTVAAAGLTAASAVGAAALHASNGTEPVAGGVTDWWLMGLVGALAYGGTGAWLGWLQPRLVIGWLFAGIGALAAVSMMSLEYGVWALGARAPGAADALWLGNWLWIASILPIVSVVPLLLPDGRLPSRRWWPALGAGALAVLTASAGWALTPYDGSTPELSAAGLSNPFALPVLARTEAQALIMLMTLLGPTIAVAGAVARWRRSTGVTRQQLKWVLLGVGAAVAVFAAGFLLGPTVTGLAMLPLPVAVAVAALRYGLRDVDVVISRSLVYAALVACVVAAYVTVVALLGDALGRGSGAPVLVTALVAVAVEPVLRRLRGGVNRLVHGSEDDPWTGLAKLGARLEAAEDADAVDEKLLPQLVASTVRTLHLRHASLELADGSVVAHGRSGEEAESVEAVPVMYAGRRVATLAVTPRSGGLSRSDRRILTRLAEQVGVAAHSALLAHALRRSRDLLVAAREEERRRLYRDLHDGLGPSLAALALNVEVARDALDTDAERTKVLLDRVVPRLRATVGEVRSVTHGLRPPALDDLGLEGAVRELAGGFAGPALSVRVESDGLVGLPAATEVATYRIVAEALNNVSRHAQASEVVVRLVRDEKQLRVSVDDDGRGFPAGTAPGIGLASMNGRAEELGGRLGIGPGGGGRGTSLHVVLPAVAP